MNTVMINLLVLTTVMPAILQGTVSSSSVVASAAAMEDDQNTVVPHVSEDEVSSLAFEGRVSRIPRIHRAEGEGLIFVAMLSGAELGVLAWLGDPGPMDTPYQLDANDPELDEMWNELANEAIDVGRFEVGGLGLLGVGRGGGGDVEGIKTREGDASEEVGSAVDACMVDCFGRERSLGECVAKCHGMASCSAHGSELLCE